MAINKNLIVAGLSFCLLAIWLIIATALFASLEKGSLAYIGWMLTGAVVVMALLAPFNGAGVLAVIIAAFVFFGAEVVNANTLGVPVLSAVRAPVVFMGIVNLLGSGFLSDLVSKRLKEVQGQLAENRSTIEELTIKDSLTGVLKWVYAERLLGEEIERSRRFGHSVSLIDLNVDDWQSFVSEKGQELSDRTLTEIGKILSASLRNMDFISHLSDCRFLVILPETPLEGAHVAAERLCREVSSGSTVTLRAGIAEFPSDAVSKLELLSEAHAALQFARNAGINVASRSLIT